MADKHIGALPSAPDIYDDSLLVAEQQGEAVKISGRQLKNFAQSSVSPFVDDAQKAANDALAAAAQIGTAAAEVKADADRASAARNAVENLTVTSSTLEPESAAAVEKTIVNGAVRLAFGIPKGADGKDGTSFTVCGRFDTLDALKAAHPAGNSGDAYAVGTAEHNTIYLWSADILEWQDVGSLQGPPGPQGPAGADGEAGKTGPAGPGVPTGGTAGQVLAKKSNSDYDTTWIQPPSGSADIDLSAYAPKASPVFTGTISLGRKEGTVVGPNSIALGSGVEASGDGSIALGYNNISSGSDSYAEGELNVASGQASHAEGQQCSATGGFSHAEGIQCTASGEYSHAECGGTIASGMCSHAEGNRTTASGPISHAGGYFTIANQYYQMAIGRANVASSNPDDYGNYLIIGNGGTTNGIVSYRANCFRATETGVYASGNYYTSGADYAEMFEWADGNPNSVDRVGRFVTLDGAKIRLAGPEDDYILGIVSGNPSVVGDVFDDQWQGMFLYDIFGRPLWENVEVPEMTDEKGRVIIPAHTEHRQKLNPNYNNSQPYIPRSDRPEWDAVGLMGKLVAVDSGACEANGWCTVGEGGIAVRSEKRTKFRVMERLDENHIRVLIL